MVRLHVEELPQSSVAVHVRVTENSCGQLPGVVTLENVGTTLLSHASEAVAEPKLGWFGHSTFDTVGQVINRRCIIGYRDGRLQVEELPQSSVAVQVRVTENSCGQLPGVCNVGECRNYAVIACIGSCGRTKVRLVRTLHIRYGRTSNNRRCIIGYRDGPAAGRRVAAIIGSCPGACYREFLRTVARSSNVRECRNYVVVACIGSCGRTKVRLVRTLHIRYGRTSNNRRCIIRYRDGTAAGRRVAAIIGSCPGTSYREFLRTVAR
jgi:hypothetical protein